MPKKWLTQIILAIFKNLFLCMTPFIQFRSNSTKFLSNYCLSWHVWLSTGINTSGNMSKITGHIRRPRRALTETPKDGFQPQSCPATPGRWIPTRSLIYMLGMAQSPPPLETCSSNSCNKKLNRSQRIISLQKYTTHCSKKGEKVGMASNKCFLPINEVTLQEGESFLCT